MNPSGHEVCPGLLKRIRDAIDNRTATKDEYKRLSGYLKDKLNNGQILTPAEMDAAGKLGIVNDTDKMPIKYDTPYTQLSPKQKNLLKKN